MRDNMEETLSQVDWRVPLPRETVKKMEHGDEYYLYLSIHSKDGFH